jgi:adenylate cyclase
VDEGDNRRVAGTGSEDTQSPDQGGEAEWRRFLMQPDSMMGIGRHVFSRIPTSPRCQLCASPFHGPGGAAMKLIGKGQSLNSPRICMSCERQLLKRRGGAEVESSLLFADIRGSTALGERMTPTEFRDLLDRYYSTASEIVFDRSGIVDKFVGDELVAAFPPFLGDDHAARAVGAATDLLRATGHSDPSGPWVPVGAGVHTGRLWFGTVGDGSHVEITVLGDVVNTAARLVAQAAAGEVIVSSAAAAASDLDATLERRSLDLKGKDAPFEVVSLTVRPTETAASA